MGRKEKQLSCRVARKQTRTPGISVPTPAPDQVSDHTTLLQFPHLKNEDSYAYDI